MSGSVCVGPMARYRLSPMLCPRPMVSQCSMIACLLMNIARVADYLSFILMMTDHHDRLPKTCLGQTLWRVVPTASCISHWFPKGKSGVPIPKLVSLRKSLKVYFILLQPSLRLLVSWSRRRRVMVKWSRLIQKPVLRRSSLLCDQVSIIWLLMLMASCISATLLTAALPKLAWMARARKECCPNPAG